MNQIQQTKPQSPAKNFNNLMAKFAEQKMSEIVALSGGSKVKADKFVTDLTLLGMDKNILECEPISVFSVALKIAQVGLSIVKEQKQAYIVPFSERGVKKAQLQIGYIGWRILAKRAGYDIDAELVYECDKFEYTVDENGKKFIFEANLKDRNETDAAWINENLLGAMVWARDKNGITRDFISAKKLNQLKNTNQSVKAGKFSAWTNWSEEMYKAKAIKYIASKLPTDDFMLMSAVNAENEAYKEQPKSEAPAAQNLNELLSSAEKPNSSVGAKNSQTEYIEAAPLEVEIATVKENLTVEPMPHDLLQSELIKRGASETEAEKLVERLSIDDATAYLNDPSSIDNLIENLKDN
ncbi:recombinase RecT [Campylobacter concisus]|uniref:RecT family recombinase n=1 Tax=Campylobacter concisus TaxID=199 RepID=UPI0018A99CE9|nr:RecT family recombinase [Campylobacter concisus]QPI00101.1 recombinase RecT [Campylobacter concisus]QPI01890.1 recombinase RecT [Campylobacter concisus]